MKGEWIRYDNNNKLLSQSHLLQILVLNIYYVGKGTYIHPTSGWPNQVNTRLTEPSRLSIIYWAEQSNTEPSLTLTTLFYCIFDNQ